MAKVTIEEISRRTGLSRGTVSRALNDRPDINEQTKQRVLEECRRLNYVPSRAARSLATGRHYALAAVTGPIDSAFMSSLLSGAARQAARAQYGLQLVQLEDSSDQQNAVLQALAHDRIDGVFMAARAADEALARFRQSWGERPGIVCMRPTPGVSCDVVGPDERESGRLAARYMLRNAGPSDALYVHEPAAPAADERLEGFREACAAEGIDPKGLVFILASSDEDREASWSQDGELRQRLRRAARIAASDDPTAVNVMLACARIGREPGRDVAIMGQGNERVGCCLSPGLTTTEFNGEEVGRRAVETLLARAEETRMDAPQTVEVAPYLVKRGSTRSLGS